MIKWLWEKKLPYTIDLTTQKKEKKKMKCINFSNFIIFYFYTLFFISDIFKWFYLYKSSPIWVFVCDRQKIAGLFYAIYYRRTLFTVVRIVSSKSLPLIDSNEIPIFLIFVLIFVFAWRHVKFSDNKTVVC